MDDELMDELHEARLLLSHPAVGAVADLVREAEQKDEANRLWLDAVTEGKLNSCEDVCHPSYGACCGGRPGVSL